MTSFSVPMPPASGGRDRAGAAVGADQQVVLDVRAGRAEHLGDARHPRHRRRSRPSGDRACRQCPPTASAPVSSTTDKNRLGRRPPPAGGGAARWRSSDAYEGCWSDVCTTVQGTESPAIGAGHSVDDSSAALQRRWTTSPASRRWVMRTVVEHDQPAVAADVDRPALDLAVGAAPPAPGGRACRGCARYSGYDVVGQLVVRAQQRGAARRAGRRRRRAAPPPSGAQPTLTPMPTTTWSTRGPSAHAAACASMPASLASPTSRSLGHFSSGVAHRPPRARPRRRPARPAG